MAITLKVTPEDLQKTASDFQTKNKSVRTYTSNMLQLIRGISGEVWSGEAASSYITKFGGLQNDIEALCGKLDKETTNLIEIASKYSAAESENISTAGSLSNSVIS